jgi:hypothetical protein
VHKIELLEIIPKEKSTGKCKTLEGWGNAPPEDSNWINGMGADHYNDFLDELKAAKAKGGSKYKQFLQKFAASGAYFIEICNFTTLTTLKRSFKRGSKACSRCPAFSCVRS